jgi:hypothetical protein
MAKLMAMMCRATNLYRVRDLALDDRAKSSIDPWSRDRKEREKGKGMGKCP